MATSSNARTRGAQGAPRVLAVLSVVLPARQLRYIPSEHRRRVHELV